MGALLAVVFCLSYGLTGRVRLYAQRRLLDIPNARSSHEAPTPRGGGLAIAVAFSAGLAAALAADMLEGPNVLPMAGGLLVAGMGFWDDHGHVPARWRLLVHLCAAALAVYGLGGLDSLQVGGQIVAMGWMGSLAGVVFIAWMLNLFNFMDGIDGIAAGEALSVAAGAAALSLAIQRDPAEPLTYALLAASVTGFLLWNWPPARIFMGDVGSGFLGFMLGVFALASSASQGLSLAVWLILAGVFVVDASYTLLYRMASGQRWYEAHRSHAYQKATHLLGGHAAVTRAVLAINVFWLLPLACIGALWPTMELMMLFLAYLPLTYAAFRLEAGRTS